MAGFTFWAGCFCLFFFFLNTGRRILPFKLNWSEITSTIDKIYSDEQHAFPAKLTAVPINTSQN